MGISLGNLSVDELIKRTGIGSIITDDDKNFLNKYRVDQASITPYESQLHIFDIPFSIHISEPIYDNVLKMLSKYNDLHSFDEPLQIVKVEESIEERTKREAKIQKEKEREEAKNDPNRIWHIQFDCLVPVICDYNNKEYYYDCFINLFVKGYNNIPETAEGTMEIWQDEEGFHGNFIFNSNDLVKADDNWVFGSGFIGKGGNRLGSGGSSSTFEKTTYSIRQAIDNYKNIIGSSPRTIYYDKAYCNCFKD